jgi:hypothetical protein
MLDISRDRVPKRETLEWLVGVLSALGFNELQLYIEHAYAFSGHEEVWEGASALTSDDMKWLDRACEVQGVDLVANLNCFGHMQRWLAHERYRDRAECLSGWLLVPVVGTPSSAATAMQRPTSPTLLQSEWLTVRLEFC